MHQICNKTLIVIKLEHFLKIISIQVILIMKYQILRTFSILQKSIIFKHNIKSINSYYK